MRIAWLIPVFLAALWTAVPVRADSAPAPEDPKERVERNRRLVEKWRADPEHYARLKRDLQAFRDLPEDQKQQLRNLDHALQELDSSSQARLFRVMERYADWLASLPEADRRRIEEAPDSKARMRVIRELREREWIERLPKKVREQVQATQGKERHQLLAKLKKEEKEWQDEWRRAAKIKPPPVRAANSLPDLPDERLRQFARWELTEQERKDLKISPTEPGWRNRLLNEYFKRHPDELKKLRRRAQQKQSG